MNLSLSEKPDMNRMVAEKLSTPSSGCNCQRMMLILVQDGEVIIHHTLTPTPCVLKELKDNQRGDLIKKGEAYYRDILNYDTYEEDFDPKLMNIERHPKFIPTIRVKDKHYYQSPCYYSDEAVSEVLYSFSCPEDIIELPNGIYHVLWEQACYSYRSTDGEEGDSDFDYKIYPSVPLWDFLKNKDRMIKEAAAEAQELANMYLYIQQTKQNRKKEEREILHDENGFTIISPQEFVTGSWRGHTQNE